MATILVLGGSFGGLSAAYELRKHLAEAGLERKHKVVLVADQPTFTYRPALPWLAFGLRRPEGVSFDLSEACARRGVDFVQARVNRVDPGRRRVELDPGFLSYDYAVLALGAAPRWQRTPGLEAHGRSPLWIDQAMALRRSVRRFRGGPAVVGLVEEVPWPCPAYEVLSFLLDHLEERGRRKTVTLRFITPEPYFMSGLGRARAGDLAEYARHRGVEILTRVRVKKVEEDAVVLDDGCRLPSELTFLLPAMEPPDAVARSTGLEKNPAGFIETDLQMRAERLSGSNSLWAVGDVVGFAGRKSGRVAEIQGRVAAWNIARELGAIKGRPRRYISEELCITRYGPGLAALVWRRPAWLQGTPKRVNLATAGRWPYYAKIALEKTWLARHR